MNNKTIGVAICCYKGHIEPLGELLKSINNQTRLPDIVVVSCSSSKKEDIPYKKEDYKYNLEIYTHEERKDAGANRNYAISKINTDILSVFDGDDIMHPQRIEVILKCFENPNIKYMIHNFEDIQNSNININENFPVYTKFPFEYNKLSVCPWGAVVRLNEFNEIIYNSYDLHNSQISIIKDVYKNMLYSERKEDVYQCDTLYSRNIINMFKYNVAYCPLKLSRYKPNNTQVG